MTNDPVAKLRGMIEQLDRKTEVDIGITCAVVSGYLLALLDADLVNDEQWQYYNSAIDRKLDGFGLPGFWNDKWLTDTNIERFAHLNKIIPGIESWNRDADSNKKP